MNWSITICIEFRALRSILKTDNVTLLTGSGVVDDLILDYLCIDYETVRYAIL